VIFAGVVSGRGGGVRGYSEREGRGVIDV